MAMRKVLFHSIIKWILLFTIAGCNGHSSAVPAPAGDKTVLEKLAASYQKLSEQLPSRPSSLTPAGKRKFVEQVFAEAGYDYTTPLLAMADGGLDPANQLHRDLVELLFLPHAGMARENFSNIYSSSEIRAIERIQAAID